MGNWLGTYFVNTPLQFVDPKIFKILALMHAKGQFYARFYCNVKYYVLRIMYLWSIILYTLRNTQYAIRNTQYAIRNTQYAIGLCGRKDDQGRAI